jgi:glucose-fructose oxidoreductase
MQRYQGVSGRTSDGKRLDLTVDNQQARQMDDDALAILEQRAPLVPGEEGLCDIRIVQAILNAAQTSTSVAI